jgi:Rps23 Pro-64 3,4-dihydroxylase Tpa1-like proline 4-hydroxylase
VTKGLEALQQPPPYRTIEPFLGEALVERLLIYADRRQNDFVPTRLSNGEVNRDVRVSHMLRDFGDLRQELEARFIGVLDWAIRELHLSPIDLAPLELELVAHGEGAFFDQHIDTATDGTTAHSARALTGVYYFHRRPKGFDGGNLRLHAMAPATDGERRIVDIPPRSDTLLLFPSWAPHEVQRISCPSGAFLDSRFAINCWYRHRWVS